MPMTPPDRPALSIASRVLLALELLIAVFHAGDFLFDGRRPGNLLAAIGFGLLAWGTWRNGAFRRMDEPAPLHAGGRNATIIGTLFVLASFFVRYALGR
jgi:hypothetical protein